MIFQCQGDPKSVFELRNPSVKCISAFSAQTQNFVRVGCQHDPMLTSKSPENRGPGGVRASLGRCQKAPGGSVALPGRSGVVAGGFGSNKNQFSRGFVGEGAPAGGRRGAGFRSLK